MTNLSKFARVSAIAGSFIWLLSLFFRTGDSAETEVIQKIFLFAVFVIVPLAIALVSRDENGVALRYAIWLQPLTALICFVSFVFAQGVVAGILAATWLATTV